MSLAGDSSLFLAITGTLVTSSAAPGVVLAYPNPGRKAAIVFNNSPNVLFLKLAQQRSGSAPSVTTADFTVQVAALSTFTTPIPCPTGSILGVWAAASGSAMISEVS